MRPGESRNVRTWDLTGQLAAWPGQARFLLWAPVAASCADGQTSGSNTCTLTRQTAATCVRIRAMKWRALHSPGQPPTLTELAREACHERDTHLNIDEAKSRLAPSTLALLESARQELTAAKSATSARDRHVSAHLAALRAAAAVTTARLGSAGRRKRPQGVWELLQRVEPALGGWAAHFADAGRRAAIKARATRAVPHQEADELLRDSEAFVSLAEERLRGGCGSDQ